MLIPTHQKKVADFVLEKLENLDTHCILAGGAPRDWYLERGVADLDFYFHYPVDGVVIQDGMVSMLRDLGFETTHRDGSVYYELNPDIWSVFDGIMDGIKIQFIWYSRPTEFVVNAFALDICQAWYKGGRIFTTTDFDIAVSKKIIRITNPLYGRGDKYIEKVLSKFPEFTFVGYTQ